MRNELAPYAGQRAIYSGRIDYWETYNGKVRACWRNLTVWPGVRQDQTWNDIKDNSIHFDHLWLFYDYKTVEDWKKDAFAKGQIDRFEKYFMQGDVYWYTRKNNSCDLSITCRPAFFPDAIHARISKGWKKGNWKEFKSYVLDIINCIVNEGAVVPNTKQNTLDVLLILQKVLCDIDENISRINAATKHERKVPVSFHQVRQARQIKQKSSGFA